MSDTTSRSSRLVHKVGIAAAGTVLTFTLCPMAEDHEHIDVSEYSPLNSVGKLAITYVSSISANDVTVGLTGVQARGSVGFVGVGLARPD